MTLWRVSNSPLDFKRVCHRVFFVVVGVSFEVSSSTGGVHSCYTMEKVEYQRRFLPPAILAHRKEDAHCLAGRGCNVLLGKPCHGLKGSCPLGQPLGLACSSASGAVLALVRHPCHPWALVTAIGLREWKPSLANALLGAKRSNRDAVTLCCGLYRYH